MHIHGAISFDKRRGAHDNVTPGIKGCHDADSGLLQQQRQYGGDAFGTQHCHHAQRPLHLIEPTKVGGRTYRLIATQFSEARVNHVHAVINSTERVK